MFAIWVSPASPSEIYFAIPSTIACKCFFFGNFFGYSFENNLATILEIPSVIPSKYSREYVSIILGILQAFCFSNYFVFCWDFSK